MTNPYFKDVQALKAVDIYRVLVLFDVKVTQLAMP